MGKQQGVWSSNAYKLVNKVLNKVLNCLLMTIESKFPHQDLAVSTAFASVLALDAPATARFNAIQQAIEAAWGAHR